MKKEVKIAITAVIALIVLYIGLNFLKGISMFSDNCEYYLTFRNIDGVAKNCPVYAEGIAIGQIDNIIYDYSHKTPTRLVALIKKKMTIPEGTVAEIRTDLMGNTQVSLILGDGNNDVIKPGGTILGDESEGMMDKMKGMIPTVEDMLPKIDSIITNLNTLAADPALNEALANTAAATANLNASSAQLNTLIAGLNTTLPPLMARADSLLTHSDDVMQTLDAADLAATMQQIDATLNELHAAVAALNSADGTLGKLMNDPAIYDNLAATLADADSLVTDLKANPKRYVHFSVFGGKNK
ncbi:MAG: MlaD family protein [Prevotella sp.]|nr:MlaD family protein [Prevotella sp.]